MAANIDEKYGYSRRKASQAITFCVKEERNASFKKVASILQKPEKDRTDEDKAVLFSCSDHVKEVTLRIEKRRKVKDRLVEVQDEPELLDEKCRTLAEALANSQNLVVYTGAGISTSACIPDYRGTNGIWTLLQQGKDIGLHDLTRAEPTRTHMALAELYRAGVLRHVVSQNCDGLHLRSGLPKSALSEVHGNMYIEVCAGCKREYWRLFDVTENTARYSHKTMRRCYKCLLPLKDTIVHFGERGTLQWPLNWPGASKGADNADAILCIGSSLKVLKKYPWLWGMDKPAKKRPKLYIINLQWTPKDDFSVLKINGKCDEVMTKVMSHLRLTIPSYERERDPMFHHATSLTPLEEHTTSQPNLALPTTSPREDLNLDLTATKPPVEEDAKPNCADVNTPEEDAQLQTNRLSVTQVKSEPFPEDLTKSPFVLPSSTFDVKPAMMPECSRGLFDAGGVCVKMETDQLSNPFALLAGFRENYVPSFTSVFNPFGLFAIPVEFFCRSFQLDHSYSKQVSPVACTKKPLAVSQVAAKKPLAASPPPPAVPTCSFCATHYASSACLYYARYASTFDPAVPTICECCDDDDDDEEPGGEEEAVVAKVAPVVNPGWYGKGCRKKIKKKR